MNDVGEALMSIPDIRSTLLQVISELDKKQRGNPPGPSLQAGSILDETSRRLGRHPQIDYEQAVLTCWYDLFRNGIMSWGFNLCNPNAPHCHVTEHGKLVLDNLSRDPANPSGYMAYLSEKASVDSITRSYIEEALNTYNSNCFRAAAVMTGAAAENLVLSVQTALTQRMDELGLSKPRDLEDWRIKRVLAAIETVIKQRKKNVPNPLFEAFEAYWSAFTHQIRTVRNESGHPINIDPVTQDTVHAALLIFPELAILADRLGEWITSGMHE